MAEPRRAEGIVTRHARRCVVRDGGRCSCHPHHQAQVYSPREQRTIRKTFATVSEARAWRAQAKAALGRGALGAASRATLAQAAEAWLEAAKAGIVRTRSGEPYKPSAIRGYEQALRTKLLPELRAVRLGSLSRPQLQELVDRLVARGLAPSTVRNAVLPLRAIYRRAIARQELLENPTLGLSLPAVRARRERVARPSEARALIEALPAADRALWASALYAGLRRGELQALRLMDLELEARVICVERSFDQRVGPIEPKSRSGRRRVPICAPLGGYLAGLGEGRGQDALVFGRTDELPFAPGALLRRARACWERAGLSPLTLHECRHAYAAYMIAAGVSAKALSSYIGSFEHHRHPRPLRPPAAGARARGRRAARRLPRAGRGLRKRGRERGKPSPLATPLDSQNPES
jgi:integrase